MIKSIPHIEIDPINRLLYVRFRDGLTHKTVEFNETIYVDLDRKGNLLGVEFLELNIPRQILSELAKRFKLPQIKKIHPETAAKVFA